MKKTYFMFTGLSLAMIACKKDFREIKNIKETENAVTAAQITCTGNNWELDDNYYSGSARLVYNNKVYVFKHDVNKILIYNGTSWDTISSRIPFRSNPSFVFTIGDKGYLGSKLFGPWSDQPDPYFWEYDFATSTWADKADYPGPQLHSGVSYFSIGNRGYVVGGLQYMGSYAKSLKTTWEYNQKTNSWAQKADLPPFISRHAATGFNIGNKGYIVNGIMRTDTYDYSSPSIIVRILLNIILQQMTGMSKLNFPGRQGLVQVFLLLMRKPMQEAVQMTMVLLKIFTNTIPQPIPGHRLLVFPLEAEEVFQ